MLQMAFARWRLAVEASPAFILLRCGRVAPDHLRMEDRLVEISSGAAQMKEHWLRIESEYIVVIIPTLMNNLKLAISEMADMTPKLVLLVADMIIYILFTY